MSNKQTSKSTITINNSELKTIGRALKAELDARKMSPADFVEKYNVCSTKTIYNIINGTKMPRKSTLEEIEKCLGLRTGSLSLAYTYFDWDYFYSIALKKFDPYSEQNEDLWNKSDELNEAINEGIIDELWGEPTLEDFLVFKCGMDYLIHLKDHKMPSQAIQDNVAKAFGMKPNELFKPPRRVPFLTDDIRKKYPKKDLLTHLDFEESEKETMIMLFNKIRPEYQKIVYNSIIDYYLLSQHK